MRLRFYARPGHVMPFPGLHVRGSRANYIGRETRVLENGAISHAAKPDPVELDSESDSGRRVLKRMRIDSPDHPLWPADDATAKACGVTLPNVERIDGEWQLKTTAAPKAATKGADK